MAHRGRDSSMEILGSDVLPPSAPINKGTQGPQAQAYPLMAPLPPPGIPSQNKGHSAISRYPEWPPAAVPIPQHDPWGQLECKGMMNDPPPCSSGEPSRALRPPRHTTLPQLVVGQSPGDGGIVA